MPRRVTHGIVGEELEAVDITFPELTELIYSTHQQFKRLQKLCEFLEETIRKEVRRRRVHAQRHRDASEDEEEQAFNSAAIDDNLFEIERDFPRIVRYSLFVSMMSTTEACLVRLCRAAHRHLNITDRFNEKGSDVIQRALEYLHNEAGLHTSRMRYYKELADSLRRLRNVITHAEGCIKGRSEEHDIRAFAKPGIGVEIDKRSNIVLSDRFVMNNTGGMKQLVIQLHGKLKKQIGAHIAK